MNVIFETSKGQELQIMNLTENFIDLGPSKGVLLKIGSYSIQSYFKHQDKPIDKHRLVIHSTDKTDILSTGYS